MFLKKATKIEFRKLVILTQNQSRNLGLVEG